MVQEGSGVRTARQIDACLWPLQSFVLKTGLTFQSVFLLGQVAKRANLYPLVLAEKLLVFCHC